MHKTETTVIINRPHLTLELIRPIVRTEIEKGANVEARQDYGAKVAVKLLGLLAIVTASPAPRPMVQAELVQVAPAADVRDWVSNFITADGEYFLLADGKLLFVKEEE